MVTNPKTIKQTGLIQVILASSFVIWLLFFPSSGDNFAWPVTPKMTALFLGGGFIVRT